MQTVMESILNKFQPGQTPHIAILKTLGALAVHNGNEFCEFYANGYCSIYENSVPFLSDILSRCVSMLPSVKKDEVKIALANGKLLNWVTVTHGIL